MPETLTKAGEVIMFSPENDNMPASKIEPFIFQHEESLVWNLFGHDFWTLLKADLVDVSGATTWMSSKTYAIDDIVDYYGLYLKSLTGSNVVNPCEDTDGSNWEVLDKFENTCYQKLWDRYLKYYMSFIVIAEVVEHVTYPAGGKGVVIWKDDSSGISSAPHILIKSRINSLINKANMVMENMKKWMLRVNGLPSTDNEYCDFSDVKFISKCDRLPVVTRGRRIITRRKRNI